MTPNLAFYLLGVAVVFGGPLALPYLYSGLRRLPWTARLVHGGLGVVRGCPLEALYREIRALRIYEGASEVQQLIIARETVAASELPA